MYLQYHVTQTAHTPKASKSCLHERKYTDSEFTLSTIAEKIVYISVAGKTIVRNDVQKRLLLTKV